MAFLGLSLVAWQTIIVIGFPFFYRFFRRIKRSLQSLLSSKSDQPGKSNTHPNEKLLHKIGRKKFQTGFLIFAILVLFIQVIFFRPGTRNPFTITKTDLKVPSSSLSASMKKAYRAVGFQTLPEEQLRLLQRLTSLDARFLFATLGRDSLLYCLWCRPPSSKEINQCSDHLLYTLPRLSVSYLVFLATLGVLTTGASRVDSKRRIWRSRLSAVSIFIFLFECTLLSLLTYLPSLMSSMDSSRMVWDAMFVFRRFVFGILLIIAWWSAIAEPLNTDAAMIARLGLGINQVTSELEVLLNRLRLAALQRSTIMRNQSFRSQTVQFWENAEKQALLVNQDPTVNLLKNEMGLSHSHHSSRDQLKEWIDAVYPDPTSSSAPSSPSSTTF